MRLRDPETLRAAIAARGLTQREAAILAGVSQPFISQLLGRAGDPTSRPARRSCEPATAHRIAAAVRVPVSVLFELREPGDPSTGPLPIPPR